jgi:hypothetical protein
MPYPERPTQPPEDLQLEAAVAMERDRYKKSPGHCLSQLLSYGQWQTILINIIKDHREGTKISRKTLQMLDEALEEAYLRSEGL